MARPVDVTTQALAAVGTGLVSRMSTRYISGQFTDWLIAGGIGIAGFFGATTGRGMVENISLGAVNGAASYIGVKMADLITQQQGGGGYRPYTAYPTPRLVGYGSGSAQSAPKPVTVKKSVIEI